MISRILYSIHYLELGGAERRLLGLLREVEGLDVENKTYPAPQ